MGPADCESRPQEKSFRLMQQRQDTGLTGAKNRSVKHPGWAEGQHSRCGRWPSLRLERAGTPGVCQRRVPRKRREQVPVEAALRGQGWTGAPALCPWPGLLRPSAAWPAARGPAPRSHRQRWGSAALAAPQNLTRHRWWDVLRWEEKISHR